MTAPGHLVLLSIVLVICVLLLWPTPGNPPGFHRDEASAALNAYSIATTGRDEDGRAMPLFFVSYGGYLSPVFPYALAAVFLVAKPSVATARAIGSFAVLVSVLLLGLLAYRRTGSKGVVAATLVLAAATPWLYELGRTGLEMTVMPACLVALVLAVDRAYRAEDSSSLARGALVGGALALLVYSYAGGRGLAPFLALALLVFGRQGARWIAIAWVTFGLLCIPLMLHLDAARARYDEVTAFPEGASVSERLEIFISNYAHDARLWHWITDGDPRPTHVTGVGHLLAAVTLLAVVGAILGIRSRDRWTIWLLLAVLLTPIPAAVTNGRDHADRLLSYPVLLLALAIGGLAGLSRLAPRRRVGVVSVLVVLTLVQTVNYASAFRERGPKRTGAFESGVPALLAAAFARSPVVSTDFDDRYGKTLARWYALTHGIDPGRAVVLSDGGIPEDGSIVFGRLQSCDFTCVRLGEADTYWIARAETGR